MKKVAIIAPIHKWEDIRVFKKEAKTLAQNGYRVTLYAKHKEALKLNSNGIEIIDINKNMSGLISRIKLQLRMFKTVKQSDASIFHFHNPDTLIIALLSKILLRKKVIYDTHEDFSQRIMMRVWIPKLLRYPAAKAIEFLEKRATNILDKVIVTQQELDDKYNNNTLVLLNAPVVNRELVMDKDFTQKIFRVIYIGGISHERGIEEFLSAYGEFVENKKHIQEFEFYLIGPCSNKYLNQLKANQYWHLVNYLGELPQEEAFAYLEKSDVGICTILDVGDHKNTSANKLYEYQMYQVPFIATNFEKWKAELASINSGIFINPNNKQDIINALEKLYSNPALRCKMGQNGREYILKEFNWGFEEKKLLSLYEEILK
ncbi:MAG: glycosyltransferase [Caryophanon sp.]|nr:glycosyltransferase [Caryophanon sp.]